MTGILTKLRLLDDEGNLSLTHLAVYLAFYCMVRGVQVSWTEMGGFLVAMASYRMKRVMEGGNPSAEHEERLTQVETDVKKVESLARANAIQARGGVSGR